MCLISRLFGFMTTSLKESGFLFFSQSMKNASPIVHIARVFVRVNAGTRPFWRFGSQILRWRHQRTRSMPRSNETAIQYIVHSTKQRLHRWSITSKYVSDGIIYNDYFTWFSFKICRSKIHYHLLLIPPNTHGLGIFSLFKSSIGRKFSHRLARRDLASKWMMQTDIPYTLHQAK